MKSIKKILVVFTLCMSLAVSGACLTITGSLSDEVCKPMNDLPPVWEI